MSIFYSWLPDVVVSFPIGTDSIASPPCSSPLPAMPIHSPAPVAQTPHFPNDAVPLHAPDTPPDPPVPQSPDIAPNVVDPPLPPPSPRPFAPLLLDPANGTTKPNPKYALLLSTLSATIPREPRNIRSALGHPGWKAAMEEELAALHQNHTWTLVPRTPDLHVIGSKWMFKSKLKPDGSLDRLKARLVAKGYHQIDGLDYTETFSPVIKPRTIRIVLTVTLVRHWPIRQLDKKNAFLNGFLSEHLYMQQPPGMADSQYPNHVCKLHKSLYGLKQAPRAWFDRFSRFLLNYGFFCSLADPPLSICLSF